MIFKQIPYKSQDWIEAVRLRERVLREPLGSKFTQEELNEEANHIQIAGFLDNQLVATAVLVPEGDTLKMQRVAVLDQHRNKAIGSHMMSFCENYALENGYGLIYCHARDTAVNFYIKNHYEPDGAYFDEDGIPHLKMKKKL